MKDIKLLYLNDSKEIVQEISQINSLEDYDISKLLFVQKNQLTDLFKIYSKDALNFAETDCDDITYEYVNKDYENQTADLKVKEENLANIKDYLISKITAWANYLIDKRKEYVLNTIDFNDTSEYTLYRGRINSAKQTIIDSINTATTIEQIIDINYNWPN